MTVRALSRAGRQPSRPDYVSASQIGKFLDCERMWGFRYIEGRQEPETEGQRTGKRVHSVLEDWFRDRKAPDLNTKYGEIAKAGLKHYPPPHPHMLVEEELGFELDGIWYLGFVDLMYAIDERSISINDHKTTVDFKWMKTVEQLRQDPQAILYSAWATLKYDIEWVELQWTYLRTTPPYKSDVTTLRWHRDEIWQAMDRIHAVAQQIVASRKKKVFDLEPNLSACGNYRGCPHREICTGKMSISERMRASFRAAKRQADAQKMKPPSTAAAPHRHLKIIRDQQPPQQQAKETTMGLMATLRSKAAAGAEAKTTTTTNGTAPKNGAARPVLLGRGKTEAAKTETPKTEAPASTTRKAPLLLRGKDKPQSIVPPAASEDHEAPPDSQDQEPPTEPPAGGKRTRKTKDAGEAVNPLMVLAQFHAAAIQAGAEPDVARQHYNAWVEIANNG